MKTKKQIRQDRLWKHFKSFLDDRIWDSQMGEIHGYDPEPWRDAFFRYQSNGSKGLTADELEGIKPMVDAQKAKEITLTSLAIESMEWWSVGAGWIYPWLDVLNRGVKDRLFKVAIMRTMKNIAKDSVTFFKHHPGIPEATKQRYFDIRFGPA